VVIFHRPLKRFQRLVNRMLFKKNFSRRCPDHYYSRTAVLPFPFRYFGDQLLSQLKLVRPGFDIDSIKALYVVLIEDRLHWLDLLKLRLQLLQQVFLQHPGMHRRLISGVFENVPGAEDQVFQLCQRNKIFN
jgi:hypothetical protein